MRNFRKMIVKKKKSTKRKLKITEERRHLLRRWVAFYDCRCGKCKAAELMTYIVEY